MKWTTIFINLAWLGFEDLHSDIHSYTVNFGSHFMGDDLNEVFLVIHAQSNPLCMVVIEILSLWYSFHGK